MPTATDDLVRLNNKSRIRWFVWPREHGAWGILLIPLLTGACVGFQPGASRVSSLVLLLIAAIALFCLRTPVEIWLEAAALRVRSLAERRAVSYSIVVYAFLAAASLWLLLWRERPDGLLLLGGITGVVFLAQALVKKFTRGGRIVAQLIGAFGLTATAAAAYYVAAARLDSLALTLWIANWLFVANQIHYVQLRIHSARLLSRAERFSRGWAFLTGQTVSLGLLLLAWHHSYLPSLAIAAFLPAFLRGTLYFLRPASHIPLHIHRLGFAELAHALLFGLLFVLAF